MPEPLFGEKDARTTTTTTTTLVLTAEEPKTPSSNSGATLVVMMFTLLFFLISLSVVVVLFVGGAFSDVVTESREPNDASARGPAVPRFPVVVRVPVLADDPTTIELKTTTPRPKAQGPETLLCTYGEGTRTDAIMAKDGLCDYAFFVSLYDDDANTLAGRRPRGLDLQTFLRAAHRYTVTTLGLAFAFQKMALVSADLSQTQPNPMEEFWRLRIFHVGVLDAPERAFGPQMLEAIRLLKMFRDLASARGYRSLTALAAPTPERDWATFLYDQGKKLGFYPDVFVVHGHYRFGDNTVDPCAVMPPTRHSLIDPPNVFFNNYKFDLAAGAFTLRELQFRNVSSRGLVSVTMKGRWTSPSPGQPFEFYSHCDTDRSADSFGSYTEVCRDSNYAPQLQYKPDHYAMLTHHRSQRRAFAYDNEEGLGTKLCKVKGEVRDVGFGIAAFDVDNEDYTNECTSLNKFGSHSRLKALRMIVDYYKSLASGNFDEASCTRVVA